MTKRLSSISCHSSTPYVLPFEINPLPHCLPSSSNRDDFLREQIHMEDSLPRHSHHRAVSLSASPYASPRR